MDLVFGSEIANAAASDELQMERIRQGVFGQTISLEQPANQNRTQPNYVEQLYNKPTQPSPQPTADNTELMRLRNIEAMVNSGELIPKVTQTETIQSNPQPKATVEATNDQSNGDDWLSQFENMFDDKKNDVQAGASNGVDVASQGRTETQPQAPTQSEIALINAGAKKGISGDAMIDFARNLTEDDYLELYEYKQALNKQLQANQPQTNQSQGYIPRNFTRVKPNQGPSVANLRGSTTNVVAPSNDAPQYRFFGSSNRK